MPEIEVASQNVYTAEYQPSVPIINGATNSVTFNIGSSVDFTLLSRINLYMEVYLSKTDGAPMPAFSPTESAGWWVERGWVGKKQLELITTTKHPPLFHILPPIRLGSNSDKYSLFKHSSVLKRHSNIR